MESDNPLLVYFALLLCFTLGIHYAESTSNPCFEAYHRDFPMQNIGSRNEKCTTASAHHEACDHYLPDDWYHVSGAVILTHCPKNGSCGVLYPVWMNGSFPTVTEGIVSRTACVMHDKNCCKTRLQIEMKNCTGYYVYHLVPVATCPTAYCFISDQPCTPLDSSTTTEAFIQNEGNKCSLICIIVIPVVIVLFLLSASAIVGLMYKKEICFTKKKVSAEAEDPPPPYESIPEKK